MARTVPFTEARATLSDLLDSVQGQQEHVVITRKGKPVAVVMSVDEWESWEETVEVLSDDEALAALKRSEADVQARRVSDWDEAKRDLGVA